MSKRVIVWFGFMMFNATFNNISVISWRSVLLVEETGGPGENHRPVTSHWQTLCCSPRPDWDSNLTISVQVIAVERQVNNFHVKNKLHFNEMMMKFTLHTIKTHLIRFCIVLAHWNNNKTLRSILKYYPD